MAGLDIPPHTRSGHWQLAAGVAAIVLLLTGAPKGAALALAASGLIALVQWLAWKPWAARRVPLLWILYTGYLGLSIGLLVGAAQLAGLVVRVAWPAHVIGVAGFSVMILGMVTRTALGHLGRPLQTDRSMVLSYALIILAALLRLAALLPSSAVTGLLHASATAGAGPGAVFVAFFPMMIRPRADAGGQATPVMRIAGGGAARLSGFAPLPASQFRPHSLGRPANSWPTLPLPSRAAAGNGGRPGFGQRQRRQRQAPAPALRQRMHALQRIAGAHACVALAASLRVRDEQLARSTAPAV